MKSYQILNQRDRNHKPIADYLRQHGVEVCELMKPLDMLCHWKAMTFWVEAKIPGSKAAWTQVQLSFIAHTKMSVAIAYGPEDAMKAIRERRFVSQTAKDSIAALLTIEPRDTYTPATVQRLLQR